MRLILLVAAVVGPVVALGGCSQILGMEDGHLDASLAAPMGSGGSGVAGKGGVTGNDGEAGTFASAGGTVALPEQGGAPAVAGLGGDGGQPPTEPESLCNQYCSNVMDGCTGEHAQYIDFAACQLSCARLPEGLADARNGNTVNCRLTYAKKAPSEPYTYCTWAGPGGDGKCGGNCEGFCSLMMPTCNASSTSSPTEYFSSLEACQSTCAGLQDVGLYNSTDTALQTGQDHVQCRLYHVGAAIAEDDSITHCSHAMGLSLCFVKTK